MSWLKDNDPIPGDCRSCDAIEQVIVPRARDLGGFEVRRALPSAQRQMIGPFIFSIRWARRNFYPGKGSTSDPTPHRACDRHLSFRRRDDASGQPRVVACDPSWRSQPDDCGARHRAFRANGSRHANVRSGYVWNSSMDGSSEISRGERSGLCAS